MYLHVLLAVCTRVGRWYAILQWLNIIGVITNAFLIAYVSRWGTRYDKDPEIQLWIVLGFEVSARARASVTSCVCTYMYLYSYV